MSNNGPVISRAGNLEVFGRQIDNAILGKRFDAQKWSPSPLGWENLGGEFMANPAVVAWDSGSSRLDIFAPGTNYGMFHKARVDFTWLPSQLDWEDLGSQSRFRAVAPAVASWGAKRLDTFSVALGGIQGGGVQHKWWDGQTWQPSQLDWEDLGGRFDTVPVATPAVTSWGANRLDVFAVGTSTAMVHKAWDGQTWLPSQLGWEFLGGPFFFGTYGFFTSGPPAVVASPGNLLDIFALGFGGGIYHKWWDGQTWQPSALGWEPLGVGSRPPGGFTGPLAAVGSPSGRVDVLCRAVDGAMYHKAWFSSPSSAPKEWHPSGLDWEPLGGQLTL